MKEPWNGPLEKIDDYRFRIPKSYKQGMRVDGVIYTDERMLKEILRDQAAEQVANVAFLPGILRYSLAMPDIHWGYGAPIGGVAATDIKEGVVAPGMIGYDINCGIRLLKTNLSIEEVKPKIKEITTALFNTVPAGVGSKGDIRISLQEERELLVKGARWAVERGYGIKEDLECTEDGGCMEGAEPGDVSERAYERGKKQSGTLGSGNHFLEVQEVERIYEHGLARRFALREGQIMLMIHSGSRGLGYQVCDDYLAAMGKAVHKYNIRIPDRQLACAPINSPEARAYISAMRCAANYAWANRQCLMHLVRLAFERVFNKSWESLGIFLVYDVAHNIAKFEKYNLDGEEKTLCVHRKGATRAFGPGHPELPARYRETGQPVIIPGDMGRHSFLLVGTEKAKETFFSTCHGAGRLMSRTRAVKSCMGRNIPQELAEKGVVVMASSRSTLAEEVPEAYKDVEEVVKVVSGAGISKIVCRMRPLGVIKG